MLQLLRTAFLLFINDIDSGNTNISQELLLEIFNLILKLTTKEFSKMEAADYIGVSRATFDNYINKGLIPKGTKRRGFKELAWNKSDLDKYLGYDKNI